ncbi:MAG: hypothetical protein M3454_12400 [Actinomycetota bacterium]|nr:hypothetical protein [Actinomycetota bacterium]
MAPTRRADCSPPVRCAALMGRQFGLITRIQARRAGLSERQIDHRLQSGMWRLVHPRVYAASEYPVDWHQRSLAACLWAGPPAALSHRSAGLLWKLEGIVGSRVEITTPRRLADSTVLIHRSSLLKRDDVTHIRGLPVTSVGRTLLDLAAVVPLERFEIALDSALCRGLTSTRRLGSEIGAQARGRPGAAALRKAVSNYQHPPIESPLERRFLKLVRAAGLPEPAAQHAIYADGKLVARVDFAYTELRLGIEVDGCQWHSGRRRWACDLVRRNELTTLQWRILHITSDDMSGRGDRAIELIKRARRSYGVPPG